MICDPIDSVIFSTLPRLTLLQQPCTISSSTTSTTTTTSSAPTPTGGFWLGELKWTLNSLDAPFLIGDHDHSCERLGFPNITPFQTLPEDSSGNEASVSILTSGQTFSLSQNFLGNGDMCGISGLQITFTPNGDELGESGSLVMCIESVDQFVLIKTSRISRVR